MTAERCRTMEACGGSQVVERELERSMKSRRTVELGFWGRGIFEERCQRELCIGGGEEE